MLFFIDESGHDRRESPYEVLAAASIREDQLWEFVCAEKILEELYFGTRLHQYNVELKGSSLLKKKRFRHANQKVQYNAADQRELAHSFLHKGGVSADTSSSMKATAREFTAFSRASLEFVHALLDLAKGFKLNIFASMIAPEAPRSNQPQLLRKDYVYLFERIFYYLDEMGDGQQGLLVMDELEKTHSKILLDQVGSYFTKTHKGKLRSKIIVPEPFFVHSDLTTLTQFVDIAAYIINWGFRRGKKMTMPARTELYPYAGKIDGLEYVGRRGTGDLHRPMMVYGINCITNLG